MIPQLETAVLNQRIEFDDLSRMKNTTSPSTVIHNLSIEDVIKQKLDSHSRLKWESDQENAFFIGDLGEVYRQYLRWQALLPRIEPHFGKSAFFCVVYDASFL